MGVTLQHRNTHPVGVGAEPLPEWSDAKREVENTVGTSQGPVRRAAQRIVDLVGVAPSNHARLIAHGGLDDRTNGDFVHRCRIGIRTKTLGNGGELGENFPFIRNPGRQLKYRLAVVGDASHPEVEEGQVVMTAIQVRRRRQNHICVSRRFVEINVDAHHEVERRQSVIELAAVRCGDDGVSPHHHHCANLSATGRGDFFGHEGCWVLAERFGKTTNTSLSTTGLESLTDSALTASGGTGSNGQGKHRSPNHVEVSRYCVEHVHQPRRGGAKAHRARPDAAVHRGTCGVTQLQRDATNGGGIDAHRVFDDFGREGGKCVLHFVESIDVLGEMCSDIGSAR